MFNVKHSVDSVLQWLGESLTADGRRQLARYARWLVDEAAAAGGLGPYEEDRIETRHLADALSFGGVVPRDAGEVLDLGSGVGLPGIPLAILRPSVHFVLLDRSRRRCDLAARAVRLIDLDNGEIVCAEVAGHRRVYDAVTMRAVLLVERAFAHFARLLGPEGIGAIGWRRSTSGVDPSERHRLEAIASRHGLSLSFVSVPVLDSRTVLLRITRT